MARCFLGVLLFGSVSYTKLFARSRYLPASVLHFFTEGEIGLCGGDDLGGEGYFSGRAPLSLFGVLAGETEESVSHFLYKYQRWGREALRTSHRRFSFAIWNKRTHTLTLGGVKCYISLEEDGLWFSTERNLLSYPMTVEIGVFPAAVFDRKTEG